MRMTIAPDKHRGDVFLFAGALILLAVNAMSCANPNPNFNRILTSIVVTPATADAQNFPFGQVLYSANGTFTQQPFAVLVPSTPPYSVAFAVGTTNTNQVIATIVTQGQGTAAVQCVAGMSGTVSVSAVASGNNGTSATISGTAQITCP